MDPELLFFVMVMSVAGAALGTFTGLVPGIHVNTLAAMMLILYPSLESMLSVSFPAHHVPILVASCIVSAAVVHSFVDFVPSVFLGAPDPDEVMNMLPGHRMLMDGNGMKAVRAAAIGSVVGSAVAVLMALPLQFLLMNGLGAYMESITIIVLIVAVLILVVSENGWNMIWAAALILLSGVLGTICMLFLVPSGILPAGDLLFPLLTGLFGMPAMILSLNNGNMPEQIDSNTHPVDCIPGIKGVITGSIVGWFPGITSTAGAVIAGTVMPEKKPERFVSMIASIGSAATVIALITLSVSGNGRTGTMVAIGEVLENSASGLDDGIFLVMLLSVAVACLVGYHATIKAGKWLSVTMVGRDIRRLNMVIIAVMVVLVILMTGLIGIVILAISTIVGFIPTSGSVSRVHLSGCLIIPVILLRIGLI